jgi:hypothetical protein
MYQQTTNQTTFNQLVDKAISEEQFNQLIEAILSGKYSWACVLLLRFAGHNPLHYIPYRTYNRIVKENRQTNSLNQYKPNNITVEKQYSESNSLSSRKCLNKVDDLAYLELLEEQHAQVQGRGNSQFQSLAKKIQGCGLTKVKLLKFKDKVLSVYNW